MNEEIMMSIQKAQEKYDNMLPDDEAEEHNYSGEIDIKGVVFCYEDGKLEQVIVPWDKYMNWPDRSRELYLEWAEEEAYTSWLSSQEERSYYDY
jgi:hypothetical protein